MGCRCSGLAQMYGWHPVPENLPAPVFLAAVAATIVPAAFFTTMAWPVEVKSNRPWGQRALHRLGRICAELSSSSSGNNGPFQNEACVKALAFEFVLTVLYSLAIGSLSSSGGTACYTARPWKKG